MRLKIFQAAGLLGQVWTDRMLEPGELWDSRIKDEVTRADVVILLLSNAALASQYIQTVELKAALERSKAGTAKVVPVVLELCSWNAFPQLQELQVLSAAKPVGTWRPRNAGWFQVTEALRTMVERMQQTNVLQRGHNLLAMPR